MKCGPIQTARPSSSNRRYLDGTAASDPRSETGTQFLQPNRPLSKSSLLQSQVKHFRDLEKDLPPERQTGIPIDSITTEGQAAEYIRRMTVQFHRPPGGV